MSIKVVGSNLVHKIPIKQEDSGGGGSSIVVDSELSLISENPVQNKVITQALNEIGTADSELSLSSENPVQNKVITQALAAKAPVVTEVAISTAGAVTQTLDPGKLYHFTGALSSLTIEFNSISGVIAQYHFDFDSGSTPVVVTLPNSVTMPGGTFAPEASKHYEVDILNNYGAVMSW